MTERLTIQVLEQLQPARWRGRLQLPRRPQPTAVLVFELEGRHVGVPGYCPHEGQDLANCPPEYPK
jgi:hypothetical protein